MAEQRWRPLIVDEAQAIKNAATTTTKQIAGLDAYHRFCLTGTPVENNLGELWSLFSVAIPGLLGERQSFTRCWRTPIEKGGDVARGKLLSRRVRPFLLRRTKDQVARDLPAKTVTMERIELGRGQRDVYGSTGSPAPPRSGRDRRQGLRA
jgi:SNF2 family DNA or RNA helicase